MTTCTSCKFDCPIGYIVKDFVKPIMQALTVQLTQYNMRLIQTKCLNTAVMFMYLFKGPEGLKSTHYCDVDTVRSRYNALIETRTEITYALQKSILRKSNDRQLYYIMITHGDFIKPDGSKVSFPGHVFIIEKFGEQYKLYQSYIDQYDFNGFWQKHNSITFSKDKIKYFMTELRKLVQSETWTQDTSAFWKEMTDVDTSRYIGAKINDACKVCYRKVSVKQCLKHLLEFVNDTLKKVPTNDPTAKYGNKDIYNSESEPLTNEQMLTSMKKLKEILINYK